MKEPFTLHMTADARWVVHPPQDPHGDGYIHTVTTELYESGLSATTTATVGEDFTGRTTPLAAFVNSLATDWQGWEGTRTWQSLDRELTLDARHDRRRNVSLSVTLREPNRGWSDSAWTATAVFDLEAGEETTRFAADLTRWLKP